MIHLPKSDRLVEVEPTLRCLACGKKLTEGKVTYCNRECKRRLLREIRRGN